MRIIISLLCFFCATYSVAQIDLTALPKVERDSALVKIAQNFLLHKFPDRFKKSVIPTFGEGDFRGYRTEWIHEGMFASVQIPSYVKPEDVWYEVTLYYKDWDKAGWNSPYTIRGKVIGRTGELCEVWFGSFGYAWTDLQKLPDVSPAKNTSALRKEERDRDLTEIARKTVKEEWPELYREPTFPLIEQYDFSVRRLDWILQDHAVPDYVKPDDRYYVVTLCYEDWDKEKEFFFRPYIARVYIIESTREAYKIESGAYGDAMRSLLKTHSETTE